MSTATVDESSPGRRPKGSTRLLWDRLRRDRVAVLAMIVLGLIVAATLGAPLIAAWTGHGPNAQYLTTGLSPQGLPVGPGRTFLFGADDLGRDVLVRIAYGGRISLFVGVVATGFAIGLGVVIGLVAGYYGGVVDAILSRFMDVVLSLPFLIFAVALIAIVGPGLWVSVFVIAFFSWASVGRVVRGQTLSIRQREFVEAARSIGASGPRIMLFEILPNVMAPVIVYATLLVPSAIVFESTLDFLGIGVTPPTPTWGNMLAESLNYFQEAWWFVVFPGAALLLTTLAFNVLGDAVRDALAEGER